MRKLKRLLIALLINPYRLYVKASASLKAFYFTTKVKVVCEDYKSVRANENSSVTKKTMLGNNVNFNGIKISGGGRVSIGDNFHSGSECMIITQNHNYESTKIPYDSSVICKDVVIEDNVWLGNRVMILPGVRVGEGAIIQAGSVVVKDIPRCAIAGGSPARAFSERNIEYYEQLKSQKRFH